MDQNKKPGKPTVAERNEKVRQALIAASTPLGPNEIAERIGEDWCSWNGQPSGSAVMPALRQIGATSQKGKWALKAQQDADEVEPGPAGSDSMAPFHVMSPARWERIQADMAIQQK